MRIRSLAILVLVLLLAGCSKPPPPTPEALAAQAAAANEAQAAQRLALYEQLRTGDKSDLASEIGQDIVAKYPGTNAAKTVALTLGELTARAKRAAESRRVAKLWTYHAVREGGGTQYSAYVSADGSPAEEGPTRVRLVLRQHPEWGQSVYLLRDEGGFACAAECRIQVTFDGEPAQNMAGTIPPTGEPAVFIDDDRTFIAKLRKTKAVTIEAQWKGGETKPMRFEVTGLDMTQLPASPK